LNENRRVKNELSNMYLSQFSYFPSEARVNILTNPYKDIAIAIQDHDLVAKQIILGKGKHLQHLCVKIEVIGPINSFQLQTRIGITAMQ
jgi:hypothetical protein